MDQCRCFRHQSLTAATARAKRLLAVTCLTMFLPFRDRPQTWVRPRKSKLVPSVSGWRAPSVICGRKSTRRVLSGWSVSPNRARRLPRTASTRLASTILSNAMIASSANRASVLSPLRRGLSHRRAPLFRSGLPLGGDCRLCSRRLLGFPLADCVSFSCAFSGDASVTLALTDRASFSAAASALRFVGRGGVSTAGSAGGSLRSSRRSAISASNRAPQALPLHAAARSLARVIELLQRDHGAAIDELIDATDWLAHTTRAALTGLRKRGDAVVIDRSERGSFYRIQADLSAGDRASVARQVEEPANSAAARKPAQHSRSRARRAA